jgi:hypothetical protein
MYDVTDDWPVRSLVGVDALMDNRSKPAIKRVSLMMAGFDRLSSRYISLLMAGFDRSSREMHTLIDGQSEPAITLVGHQ